MQLGAVIRLDRGFPLVATANDTFRAEHAVGFAKSRGEDEVLLPAVGDRVAVRRAPGHDMGVIECVLPRRTSFERWRGRARGERQVLCSNVDSVLIVQALGAGEVLLDRVARSLVLALDCDAEPVVVLTKADRCDAEELERDLDRLEDARKNVAFGAISGAVGTYSSIEPFVEEYVCEHLGLVHDPLSTQVISRDHHAYLAGVLATTAATCERIATEVRNLQKTDTLEAEEPFRKGQKGSSAMPHKRNPITMEKVCGLSRVVKANAQVAFDNVALWHERDISHSSAERVAQADSFIALDHMFQCLIRVIDGLQLYPARMMANLNKTRGLIFSSKVLLALVDTGITREDAYAIVQENAMATWHEVQDCVSGPTFKERLEADPRCTVSQEKLDEIFDPWDFLTRIDTVFDRLEQLSFE